jgi:beta-1,4-mannosyl-glycoprotein beta-1,4-N-acetylglucosaminyltransferase
MKIYDCFILNHEIDILELRLNVLDDYVDKFIITEGDTTFSGKEKESFYLKNKKKFSKWENKIIHNFIQIPKNLEVSWDREIYSRNASLNLPIFNDEDIIISSDVDEIPNPEILKKIDEWISDVTHFTFQQIRYVYYLNNVEYQYNKIMDHWFGTRVATYRYMKNTTIDNIREATEDENKITGSIITNGGWHFSHCYSANDLKKRVDSFSDVQYQTPEIYNNIENNLMQNKDLYFRDWITYKKVDLDDSFPEYVLKNKNKFSHLLK